MTVHRRVHHMKVEKVIAEMAEPGPELVEVQKSGFGTDPGIGPFSRDDEMTDHD